MKAPKKTWSKADSERRDRILEAARLCGMTRRKLGEISGLPGTANAVEVRMHRWAKGERRLPESALVAMEKFLEGQTSPAEDGGEGAPGSVAPELLERRKRDLLEIAGEPPEDAKDELRGLASKFRRMAIGELVRQLLTEKNASVRQRAAEILLERSDGKAVQAFVDNTPRPPEEDAELIAAVDRVIEEHLKKEREGGSNVPS